MKVWMTHQLLVWRKNKQNRHGGAEDAGGLQRLRCQYPGLCHEGRKDQYHVNHGDTEHVLQPDYQLRKDA